MLIGIIVALSLASCQNGRDDNNTTDYSAETFKVSDGQFGYDIYQDTSVIIHQPMIPAIAGNSGFVSEDDAKKVADLMIYKLANGIMPPAISVRELDSLKIKPH